MEKMTPAVYVQLTIEDARDLRDVLDAAEQLFELLKGGINGEDPPPSNEIVTLFQDRGLVVSRMTLSKAIDAARRGDAERAAKDAGVLVKAKKKGAR